MAFLKLGKSRKKNAIVSSALLPPTQDIQTSDGTRSNSATDLYPWSQRRLVFQTPQSNPFPRYGAAVNAVASKDGDIYVMGGLINGSMVSGDLWMIESGGGTLSCYPIATVSKGPGPRVGHSSLLIGNAFIVFGGDTKVDDSDMLDDTLYLLNTSSRQWSRAAPPGPRPASRYGHTLNVLGSRIYIFGGQVEGTFFNDLITFDLNALQHPTNQWEFLLPNTIEGDSQHALVPAARTNHSMISYNDQLYLFGGTDGNRWFNDVWTYNLRANSWSQQDCIGSIPAPRENHSAALVGDVMYIFGGRTEEGTDLGDLAAFRITFRRWYTFSNMGPSPSPRSGHSMTVYGKQIAVLAGEPISDQRDASELSMVYLLDTAKIRYPIEHPASSTKDATAIIPNKQPSNDVESEVLRPRSVSREGQTNYANSLSRTGSSVYDTSAIRAMPMDRPFDSPPDTASAPLSAPLLRTSLAQAPAAPSSIDQAPTPFNQKANGVPQQDQTKSEIPAAEEFEKYKLTVNVHDERTDQLVRDSHSGLNTWETWRRKRHLGQGAFSEVWQEEWEDKHGDWHYRAVKVCSERKMQAAQLDYKRELSALVAFSRSECAGFFIDLHGWWIHSGNVYLAMEYLRHGDLSHFATTKLKEIDVKEITDNVLRGLKVMHEEGFTHRDIKPQNILVVKKRPEFLRWWVKIADFGISKRVLEESGSALHSYVGTRRYCAPEVLGHVQKYQETSIYTSKVDMWSLGCVLFNLSSQGQMAFSESDLVRYCDGILSFNPQGTPLCLGDSGESFLKTLLTVDPGQRPTATEALQNHWLIEAAVTVSNTASVVHPKAPWTGRQNYNSFLDSTFS